ncbi:uncharacterized protein DFL_005765 [Arthrobotrys flagrans]|uniref:Uncharacterized protein n=1 Tax=Arthrobotrys flagrans TaxID=97331 RepID=A0A436ZYD7_ARTFL|nr:hypothetical protein DFL_005765 [Arthrobotrys flagrans]
MVENTEVSALNIRHTFAKGQNVRVQINSSSIDGYRLLDTDEPSISIDTNSPVRLLSQEFPDTGAFKILAHVKANGTITMRIQSITKDSLLWEDLSSLLQKLQGSKPPGIPELSRPSSQKTLQCWARYNSYVEYLQEKAAALNREQKKR